MAFAKYLPEKLVGKDGEVDRDSALAGKTVGFYFSAHWCPPCRGFTPELAKFYTSLKDSKNFEIVFVSSDKDQDAFDEYYGEQPWLALPFADRETKGKLSKKFKVEGIPTFVLLDADGNVITTSGREEVGSDPKGENFPWKPKPLSELIGDKFQGKDGMVGLEAIKGKVLGIYFSAHWCPPCRGFTPKLAETYKKLKAENKNFEIIFASSDRDQKSFEEYYGEQPWLALPFEDRDRKAALSKHFDVSGIPSFIILDENLKVITDDGRSAVSGDPEGKDFPWLPKPVNDLAGGPGGINESTSIVLFNPTEELTTELNNLAQTYWDAAKATGEDPEYAFFTAKDPSSEIAQRIMSLCKLEAKAGEAQLLLLDIPDEGAYYTWDKAVGAGSLKEILEAYTSKSLTRKQLG